MDIDSSSGRGQAVYLGIVSELRAMIFSSHIDMYIYL